MKEQPKVYKHPVTGQQIARCNDAEYRTDWVMVLANSIDDLKAMGFDEVEEEQKEVPEWFRKVFLTATWEDKVAEIQWKNYPPLTHVMWIPIGVFYDAFLQHYPKQDTISIEDLYKSKSVTTDLAEEDGSITRVLSLIVGWKVIVIDNFTYKKEPIVIKCAALKPLNVDEVMKECRAQLPYDNCRTMYVFEIFEKILQKYAAPENTLVPLEVEKVAKEMFGYYWPEMFDGYYSVIVDNLKNVLHKYWTPKITEEEVDIYMSKHVLVSVLPTVLNTFKAFLREKKLLVR